MGIANFFGFDGTGNAVPIDEAERIAVDFYHLLVWQDDFAGQQVRYNDEGGVTA